MLLTEIKVHQQPDSWASSSHTVAFVTVVAVCLCVCLVNVACVLQYRTVRCTAKRGEFMMWLDVVRDLTVVCAVMHYITFAQHRMCANRGLPCGNDILCCPCACTTTVMAFVG